MIDEHYQIGEAAEQAGLSLRTIRYYEEIGLVTPSGRTEGGFRLYTDADVDRLRLVKALKPVGMSLDALGALLDAADEAAPGGGRDPSAARTRLAAALAAARDHCDRLEESIAAARDAVHRLGAPASGSGT